MLRSYFLTPGGPTYEQTEDMMIIYNEISCYKFYPFQPISVVTRKALLYYVDVNFKTIL